MTLHGEPANRLAPRSPPAAHRGRARGAGGGGLPRPPAGAGLPQSRAGGRRPADSPLLQRPHLRHALCARPRLPRRGTARRSRFGPASALAASLGHRRAAAVLGASLAAGGRIRPAGSIRGAMLPHREEIASVVVCEDDTATLELLCDHLAADRFGVLPAPSASDALRLCRYNQPDLLLLDLIAARRLRPRRAARDPREPTGSSARFDPRLPVIVLTGRGADAERVRGLESGADDYLVQARPLSGAARPDHRGAAALRRPAQRAAQGRGDRDRPGAAGGQGGRARGPALQQGVRPAAGARVRPDPGLLQGRAAATRSGATGPSAAPARSTPTPAGCAANSTPSTAATSSTAGASAIGWSTDERRLPCRLRLAAGRVDGGRADRPVAGRAAAKRDQRGAA